ncbi:predicted protein [Lichtheimia corymbifera JMRC:FSU:9682]|uniref:Uncharacterized protein n=1 Tax=Lichtheimia corymbifera JMRC:FSU:9682 TaxID=1263082 RepID=A0A068SAK3_9FUNG|nr:predicted protein [Lichtheimia corymbifera JMRC:FSU:9682]
MAGADTITPHVLFDTTHPPTLFYNTHCAQCQLQQLPLASSPVGRFESWIGAIEVLFLRFSIYLPVSWIPSLFTKNE